MTLWRERSLAVRITLAFALVVIAVTGALGGYGLHALRISLDRRAEVSLVGRVAHFRRLLGEMDSLKELTDRPALFATMLGAEQDVLIFRKPGQPPFIAVNPAAIPVPALRVAPPGRPTDALPIARTRMADGTPVYWTGGTALAGGDGGPVEIVAGHPMGAEMRMLSAQRERVLEATLAGMLAATLLAHAVLRHGLRPLREVTARAARIGPATLEERLDSAAVPVEMRQLVQAFNATLDRLAQGYQRLAQFSADLAHEIRTPVGALIGETQVALARPRTVEEYQQVLGSNLEELDRLRRIAENILFLAQADHGTLTIERAPVPLAEELAKIADYFEGLASERGMAFDIRASGTAWANPDLCRRAINNLVVNAVRHGSEHTRILLSGEEEGGQTRVVVENQAAPMPADQRARLFDRFYRADPARSVFTESQGLGLSIVRAIMTLHGGEATVHCPTPGVFRFELRFPG